MVHKTPIRNVDNAVSAVLIGFVVENRVAVWKIIKAEVDAVQTILADVIVSQIYAPFNVIDTVATVPRDHIPLSKNGRLMARDAVCTVPSDTAVEDADMTALNVANAITRVLVDLAIANSDASFKAGDSASVLGNTSVLDIDLSSVTPGDSKSESADAAVLDRSAPRLLDFDLNTDRVCARTRPDDRMAVEIDRDPVALDEKRGRGGSRSALQVGLQLVDPRTREHDSAREPTRPRIAVRTIAANDRRRTQASVPNSSEPAQHHEPDRRAEQGFASPTRATDPPHDRLSFFLRDSGNALRALAQLRLRR